MPKYLIVFSLVLSSVACDREGGSERDSLRHIAPSTLRKGNGAEPQTLDPHKAEGVPASNILRDLFEGLIIEAPDGTLVPGVAKSWEISPDGKRYTFHLRPTAHWSNGDPLVAEDFAFALRRSVDPSTGSKYSQIISPIVNADVVIIGEKSTETLGVNVVNQHTLEIMLNAPTSYFLGLLTHSSTYPVHRESINRHGNKFTRPGNLISNGAYQLEDWIIQSHITLKRNPNYWDADNTSIDRVIYYAIDDQTAELRRYRAGDIDWTDAVPLTQIRWIRKHLPKELKVSPYIGTYYYGFNLTKPPFKDNLALRKALSMAIDREIIVDKMTALGEAPAYGWVPLGIVGYSSQSLSYQDLDSELRHSEAERLYQQAGYSRDNPLTVELRYNTSENHKKIALVVAAMWKKYLGVHTVLINEEWKVFLNNRKQRSVTQIFRSGWIGDYNDATTFLSLMGSRHGINDSGYNNPVYDDLLEKAAGKGDPLQRRHLLEDAEKLMLRDHPIIPLYFYVSKSLIKPHVKGYMGNLMDHHYTKHYRLELR